MTRDEIVREAVEEALDGEVAPAYGVILQLDRAAARAHDLAVEECADYAASMGYDKAARAIRERMGGR